MSNSDEVFFLGMGIGEISVCGRVKYLNKKKIRSLDERSDELGGILEASLQINKTDILLLDNLTNLDYLLLLRSAGVISKSGGATSHGAIILREMCKPAVIGLGEDVNNLKEGDWVMLNPKEDKVIMIQEMKKINNKK